LGEGKGVGGAQGEERRTGAWVRVEQVGWTSGVERNVEGEASFLMRGAEAWAEERVCGQDTEEEVVGVNLVRKGGVLKNDVAL
jgi:hypothetical protein